MEEYPLSEDGAHANGNYNCQWEHGDDNSRQGKPKVAELAQSITIATYGNISVKKVGGENFIIRGKTDSQVYLWSKLNSMDEFKFTPSEPQWLITPEEFELMKSKFDAHVNVGMNNLFYSLILIF